MKEESFEYFRGTKQEIENEKKRKSALMSYFPKTLGTIDSTRYILVNDDKPNLKYHFNETNFNIPASAVISNENEKSKKKQDKTTASISGFENNLKTDDFNKWEENIAYFNPNKETEETNIKNLNEEAEYTIKYGMNYFPKKEYQGVIYEEGEYESLVVEIGDAQGDNFWCVLFPPLCLLEGEEENKDNIEYTSFIKEIIEKYTQGY